MRYLTLTILVAMVTLSYSQVFTEDFENGGAMPTGWTQEYENNTIDWVFQSGGHSGHPAAAHGGSYNALFTINTHANDGAKTKLVSPNLSLTAGNDYYLTFYYANENWNGDQDTLKVYYKESGVWHYINTYNVNQVSWKKRVLPIPYTATNIAFEGESEYGYGVCIDDVRIDQITRNPTVNTCNDVFTDDGGANANYSDNQNYIQTYTSDNNSCIRAVIDYYEIESDFDFLYIYDGVDLTGELLQVYTGSSTNASTSATLDDNGTAFYGLSGSLTFYFYSDGSTNDLGWKMNIDCPDNCVSPACSDNIAAADDCSLPTPICNLNGYCGSTDPNDYSPDHTELDVDQNGTFCGTIDNNSWLTFVADATEAYIDVWVYNCTGIAPLGRVHGIQIEIFEGDCNNFTAVSNCWSPNKEANGRIKATGLTPGNTYYIMIDGWGADNCQYSFAASANSGIVVANAGIDQTICEGQTVSLNASGGTTIQWVASPADASLSGQENNTNINVSPSQTTIYTAAVSGINTNCPASTADVVVYVNEADASFTGLNSEYCEDASSSSLTGSYGSAGTFSGSGISGNTFTPSNAGIGTQDITYTYNYSVVTAFQEDFDGGVTGWTHGAISGSDSWALGEPQSGNGDQSSSSSYNDPILDHTSTNTINYVYGQGLSANNGSGEGGYYNNSNEWLKTPAIDCSNISNTTLSFWRYANFEPSWDEAYVEISINGSTWNTLGEDLYPQDDKWVFRGINISAYADGQSTVYIRWRSNNDVSTTYSGWNIDDVKVTGVQDGGSCVSTDIHSTEVFEPVVVSVSQSSASICANSTYSASGSITGGVTTGHWSTSGSGSFSSTINLSTVYTPSSTDISNGSVILTLTSDNTGTPCGVDNASINLTITPLDDAVFAYSTNTFCNTGTTVLPNVTPGANGSYSSTPTGLVLNSTTGEIDIANSVVNGYDITYTTTGTCVNTHTVHIDIVSGFNAEFEYNYYNYCQTDANPTPIHNNGGTDGTYSSTTGLVWGTSSGEIDLLSSTPGQYVVTNTISASGSCPEAVDTAHITIYEAPTVSIVEANAACSNENIDLHATYGGSATGIVWSTNGTGNFSNINDTVCYYTPSTTDISTGIITFNVTSNSSNTICSDATESVNVNIYPQPQILVSTNQPHCNLSDGSITVSATQGTSPYNYLWNNNSTQSTLSNIQSGVYSVTVSDFNNCTNDTIISLNDLNAGTIQLVSQVNPTCYGYNDGSISITMNGGTPEFNYIWTNNNDSAINPNLTAGTYSVTVTDAYNCNVIGEYTLVEPAELTNISNIYDVKCNGGNDGKISVNVTGGTGNYNYFWENTSDNVNTLNNIEAGMYYVEITDDNLCSLKDTFLIKEPRAITFDYASVDITCSEKNDGSIAVSINGGVKPYTLNWDNVNIADSLLYNLSANTYTLTLTDANNCTKEISIDINPSTESCLKIPTVFTPNGDGINDYWQIKGVSLFETISINVFNRWGDIVFKFDGKAYEYSDEANQWDGTYQNSGKVIDLSSFVYIIYLSGEDEPYQGTVTIVK